MKSKSPDSTLRAALERTLLKAWTQRGLLACFLLPISWIFGALSGLRRAAYGWGWKQSCRIDATVIVVGNVIAGGAGKTPTVISLVEHLKSRGYTVGVISRGYGRAGDHCVEVAEQSDVRLVGDEPCLIQRRTNVPVFIGRRRCQAAAELMARYPATNIVISDDGLQHYALQRDIEICVFDNRGTGNGWLLPAGPLREAWPRPNSDGFPTLVLHTGTQAKFAGFQARRALETYALTRDGNRVALADLAKRTDTPLMAIAGIAQPEVFFEMLRETGLVIAKTVSAPDHYDFDSNIHNISKGYQLICTEKDAMKVWSHTPDALAAPLVQTAEPDFFAALDARLCTLVKRPLSSGHGHPTT